MGAEDTGLTLEGLAQKLEMQTLRLETLEHENAELRHKVATLEDSGTRRDELAEKRGSDTPVCRAALAFDGQVSRRSLLGKAGAAAVAAVAAGTLLTTREAKANHFDPGIQVDWVFAHSDDRTAVTGVSGPGGIFGVYGRAEKPGQSGVVGRNHTSEGGIGVDGVSVDGIGVKGIGKTGVWGQSSRTGWGAVYGQHTELGYGVVGDGSGSGNAGVLGRGKGGAPGVRGQTDGTGAGVAGVHGVNTGNGEGVLGETTSLGGAGVFGRSTQGWGGRFEGGKAHLLLSPRDSVGPPTTGGAHGKGELSMDKDATLWVCVEGGNPGTWRRFATVAG